MTVRELLSVKGKQKIVAMESNQTVEDAIGKMNEFKVGAILVTELGRTVGIFTERDVLRSYVVMKKKPFEEIMLRDAMTTDLLVAEENDEIESVMSVMIEKSIRHLPVTDGENKIIGMLSIRDIVKSQVKEFQSKIHYLKDYVSGIQGGLWI
jgi:CBS domain-containing protein